MNVDPRCAYAGCRAIARWQTNFENDRPGMSAILYCDEHIEIVKRAFFVKNLERINGGKDRTRTRS